MFVVVLLITVSIVAPGTYFLFRSPSVMTQELNYSFTYTQSAINSYLSQAKNVSIAKKCKIYVFDISGTFAGANVSNNVSTIIRNNVTYYGILDPVSARVFRNKSEVFCNYCTNYSVKTDKIGVFIPY